MKRNRFIAVGVIVSIGFVFLLFLQLYYADTTLKMRRSQFDENVKRSLNQAARDVERYETETYLKSVIEACQDSLLAIDTTEEVNAGPNVMANPVVMSIVHADSIFSQRLSGRTPHSKVPLKLMPAKSEANSQSAVDFQRAVRNAYIYQREILDNVVYAVLYNSGQKSFRERVNPEYLDTAIRRALESNGVTLDFHFRVCYSDGRVLYQCPDYTDEGADMAYTQPLFRNDPMQNMGRVIVHFPQQKTYLLGMMNLVVPAAIFTLVLLILFVTVLYLLFRQSKLNEMKNDFVSNMTHELKTPIASISLAAQMLSDNSVKKSETMYANLGNVINKESRRLRFQVDKVLQLSLYDQKSSALNMVELNSDELIDNVVKTFSINVQQIGGTLQSDLTAENPLVCVDEMHYTNVIYNIMENALKYRRDEVPFELRVRTYNHGDNYCVEIQDNGIGIPKDDQKRVFEKFYRVHTADHHDVKGTGLGLAYVQKMVHIHGGSIKVESQVGRGTKFIITLPNTKD